MLPPKALTEKLSPNAGHVLLRLIQNGQYALRIAYSYLLSRTLSYTYIPLALLLCGLLAMLKIQQPSLAAELGVEISAGIIAAPFGIYLASALNIWIAAGTIASCNKDMAKALLYYDSAELLFKDCTHNISSAVEGKALTLEEEDALTASIANRIFESAHRRMSQTNGSFIRAIMIAYPPKKNPEAGLEEHYSYLLENPSNKWILYGVPLALGLANLMFIALLAELIPLELTYLLG